MDDRVKRLRNLVGQHIGDADIDDELSDAADCIEALEAALRQIAETPDHYTLHMVRTHARVALGERQDG